MTMIEISNLKKSYGKHVGISDVSFAVNEGEIFGFVGPNGAGKSTTIKTLMGFIFADSGTAAIDGLDAAQKSREIKVFTSYVPSEVRLYANMPVGELLRRNASFYPGEHSGEAKRLCDLFEVDLKKRFSELSSGNKKKVSIVCALIAAPRVIILDEPTNGLDPMMQVRLFEELRTRAHSGTAILLSSHNLAEVQEYCHRVAFIRKGEILTVSDLSGNIESAKIITVSGGQVEPPPELELLRGDNGVRVFRSSLNGAALLSALAELAPEDVTIENESIEDRFRSLYGGEEDER